MRGISAIILLFVISVSARAEVCGLFKIEEFGREVFYKLIDLTGQDSNRWVYYSISNPAATRGLLSGLCYCLDGQIAEDPVYPKDDSYKVLILETVRSGPTSTCLRP